MFWIPGAEPFLLVSFSRLIRRVSPWPPMWLPAEGWSWGTLFKRCFRSAEGSLVILTRFTCRNSCLSLASCRAEHSSRRVSEERLRVHLLKSPGKLWCAQQSKRGGSSAPTVLLAPGQPWPRRLRLIFPVQGSDAVEGV